MTRKWLSCRSRPVWPALILLTALLATLWLAPASGADDPPLVGQKICLDPGHGGDDPGAVNGQLLEKEINLDVSHALRWLLSQEGGAEVVMTREDDRYLTNRDRYTFCNGVQADLLISVHTNSYTDASWDGSTTLWSKREDQALAQAIHAVLYPKLKASAPDPEHFDDFGLTKFQSGVLLKSDMPAAMMEPVFMSNPTEAVWLAQAVYDDPFNATMSQGCLDFTCRRGQIAQAIYLGILYYYDSNPGPTPAPTPEPSGTMHVAAIEMSYSKKGPNVFVHTLVTIVDASNDAVPDATVTLKSTDPDGTVISISNSITGSDGVATFSVKSWLTGSYTSDVIGVAKDGWGYDATANVESVGSVTVP